jgi:serine/threonine protein kinase
MVEQRNREGQQLGNYRLERLLGRGGFAEVYLGQHLRLGRQAAIKVLHAYLSEQEIEAFGREAQIIASLDHLHILRIFDFDVQHGVPFLVMDYLPNGTLRQRHHRGETVPLPLVITYVKQVAEALQYAHEQRLIHRDVKPENMLIGRRNEVVLSDFGIAAMAHSTSSMTAQASMGTIPYMAPEQIQEHPRAASDQYALAVVVYEWLSGEQPFTGSFTEIFAKHLMTPPPPLRQKVPALSAEIEQVVSTALAKDPRQRFSSIQAFATALEQASQAAQKPAEAAFEETVFPQSFSLQPSSPLPPTVLAAPAIAAATDLKTPPAQTLAPTIAVAPPTHTPPATTVTPPTGQAAPTPARPRQHYLSALILGVVLSLVSILFIDLVPLWAGVDPDPTRLQAYPPLVISLIAGITLGKSRATLPASLLAGLLIGISGCMFMIGRYARFLPYFTPGDWAVLIGATIACGLLSWLAAWIRTHTRPYKQ